MSDSADAFAVARHLACHARARDGTDNMGPGEYVGFWITRNSNEKQGNEDTLS